MKLKKQITAKEKAREIMMDAYALDQFPEVSKMVGDAIQTLLIEAIEWGRKNVEWREVMEWEPRVLRDGSTALFGVDFDGNDGLSYTVDEDKGLEFFSTNCSIVTKDPSDRKFVAALPNPPEFEE